MTHRWCPCCRAATQQRYPAPNLYRFRSHDLRPCHSSSPSSASRGALLQHSQGSVHEHLLALPLPVKHGDTCFPTCLRPAAPTGQTAGHAGYCWSTRMEPATQEQGWSLFLVAPSVAPRHCRRPAAQLEVRACSRLHVGSNVVALLVVLLAVLAKTLERLDLGQWVG